MKKMLIFLFFLSTSWGFLAAQLVEPNSRTKAIYINEGSLFSKDKLEHLVKRSRQVGLNTFVIDVHRKLVGYQKKIAYIRGQGIQIIARIVVFPGGARPHQIESQNYLKSRIGLAKYAKKIGFQGIQLDYIRYSTKQPPSSKNALNILNVIQTFRDKLGSIPLQIAVFGEAMIHESRSIGQNLPLFAKTIDSIAPMLYPSHYRPYTANSKAPYHTVSGSLKALQVQFEGEVPFDVIPYFEMYNIRNPSLNPQVRRFYISEQIRAIDHHQTQGWIAWSANNKYHHLFRLLELTMKKSH